ncbi:MAG: DUF4142 domain-containing protein [Methylobacteriaceae bacterium]|nr:DUF4142 domain-containing protein [Methylobacteriaceae bacterium]
MKRSTLLGALAAVLAAGVSVPASAQALLPFPDLGLATESTEAFRAEALRGDAYEIESSRIALQKSRDPRVRAYARQLIADHQRTTDALLPPGTSLNATGNVVADRSGPFDTPLGIVTAPLSLPVTVLGATLEGRSVIDNDPVTPGRRVALDPRRQAKLSALEAAPPGRAFGATYATQQVQAHREAITLFQGYIQNGDDDDARAFATQALPDLQMHEAGAARLEARYVGGAPAF